MILCFVFSALIVALDQFFKYWIVRTIDLGARGPVIIPGVLGLTHWENDGAMLNFLSGQQWLLAGIALIASIALIMIILRYNEGFWGTLGLAAVLGGTVGNLFDRIFNDGKVIDMFRTLFINFPIFNIADIFITLGFITFLLHFISLTIKIGKEGAPASDKKQRYTEDSDSVSSINLDEFSGATPSGYDYAQPEAHVSAPYAAPAAPYGAASVQPAAAAPVAPIEEDYSSLLGDYDSVTDTTPEISLTMEALEAELGSLDIDYDVDELLREYGIEEDDISV